MVSGAVSKQNVSTQKDNYDVTKLIETLNMPYLGTLEPGLGLRSPGS